MITFRCANVTCLSRRSRPCAKPCAGKAGCAGRRDPDDAGNLQHQFMLRLLFYTAVRVSELVNIRVGDVDLDASKIFIASETSSRFGPWRVPH